MEKRVNNLVEKIYNKGLGIKARTTYEKIDPFSPYIYPFQSIGDNFYVKFECDELDTFYGYFQPCFSKDAPLLVHTPGYGGEMSMHPELSDSFHVLHINPLGYTTPSGKDMSKLPLGGLGTVLPDTIKSNGEHGYVEWFTSCVVAIEWAKRQQGVLGNRISFFGTSQGGFASLLLSSIYSGRGTKCVCADQPFMTNIRLANFRGAYSIGRELYQDLTDEQIFAATDCFDTANHLHRYDFSVLLTSGGKDDVCPQDTIYELFKKLNEKGCTCSYTHFHKLAHGYNREFLELCRAWFRIYA